MTNTTLSPFDQLISSADVALRTLLTKSRASRPRPVYCSTETTPASLTDDEKRHAAGLMRVNHVGEVCAQALYSSQALAAISKQRRIQFGHAAKEEADHLAWTEARLTELGARPSVFNPLWYAGAFGLGLLAGRCGDAVSLGFVVETEAQVEAHLAGHLDQLPAQDYASRAIVLQMQADEIAHGQAAKDAGATELPSTIKAAMKQAAKIMTTVAYWI